jgi:hypothetical protein
MNSSIITNLFRCLVLIFVQVLVFKHISFSIGGLAAVHFLIYPLTILLFPIRTPRAVLLVSAFLIGLSIDVFYDSLGVHAAALVFTAYIRNVIIAFLEPYEGYNIDDIPNIKRLGLGWFISYLSIALLIHVFLYFSIEAFSFVYFFEIFLNTISSFIVSFLVIIISQFIFRTKY